MFSAALPDAIFRAARARIGAKSAGSVRFKCRRNFQHVSNAYRWVPRWSRSQSSSMTPAGFANLRGAQRECMSNCRGWERDPDAAESTRSYGRSSENSSAPFRETISSSGYLGRRRATRTHRRAYRTTRYKLLAVRPTNRERSDIRWSSIPEHRTDNFVVAFSFRF